MKKLSIFVTLVLVLSMIFIGCAKDPTDVTLDKMDSLITNLEDAMKTNDEQIVTEAFEAFNAIDAEITALTENEASMSEAQLTRYRDYQSRVQNVFMGLLVGDEY